MKKFLLMVLAGVLLACGTPAFAQLQVNIRSIDVVLEFPIVIGSQATPFDYEVELYTVPAGRTVFITDTVNFDSSIRCTIGIRREPGGLILQFVRPAHTIPVHLWQTPMVFKEGTIIYLGGVCNQIPGDNAITVIRGYQVANTLWP